MSGHTRPDSALRSDFTLNDGMCMKSALAQATAAVQAATDKAKNDPSRPVYHLRPPARWMNDPNGTIAHDGWYHLFYQHNPFGDSWGTMHWGHARSRDMVHWEHLPIALAPSEELGEKHCYSGCAALDANGTPLLFYTSIGERDPEQWAAVGDSDLVAWKKHPSNPVLTIRAHGDLDVSQWRDPFVFRHDGRTFMLVGGKLSSRNGGEAACLIYESEDPQLLTWAYRGVFYRHPNRDYPHFECPNLCRVGDSWVLFAAFELSTVEYAIGDIDWTTFSFQARGRGTVDRSHNGDGAFYATNLMMPPDGRVVLFGWVKGFKENMGWNGCQSLPRELALDSDNALVQTPAREVESLRCMHAELGPFTVENSVRVLDNIGGDCIEVMLRADVSGAAAFTLELRRSPDGRSGVPVRYADGVLNVYGTTFDTPRTVQTGKLELRVFLDKSVMEVFVNGGRACCTRVVYKREYDREIACAAEGGQVRVESMDFWQMQPVFD